MNLEEVEVLSSGAGQENEDCAGYGDEYIYVVDGASGLYDRQASPSGTDASWFSHRLGELLDESLPCQSDSIPDILRQVAVRMKGEFESFGQATEIDENAWPSASLSIVRTYGNEVELYQLGDCVTLWRTTRGIIEVSRDLSVPRLDRAVIVRQVSEASRLHVSVREARAQVNGDLKENRSLRNSVGGYWTMDLGGTGIAHAQRIHRPVVEVEAVALMSDGFWTAFADLGLYGDASALFSDLESRGANQVLADIRRAEMDDPDSDRHPRLKQSDDASVVYARFE